MTGRHSVMDDLPDVKASVHLINDQDLDRTASDKTHGISLLILKIQISMPDPSRSHSLCFDKWSVVSQC